MNKRTCEQQVLEKRDSGNLARLLALHVIPGIWILIVFVLVAGVVHRMGITPLFITSIVAVLGLIPFEMGFLFYRGRQRTGRLSLAGIVRFREPLPLRGYIFWSGLLIAWMALVMLTVGPRLRSYIMSNYFQWVPAHFLIENFRVNLSGYSYASLLAASITNLLVIGFLAPVVEEIYFRGYLLPRISALGIFAPAANAMLFSIYHLTTPGDILSLTLIFTPLYYLVWKKKNIYLGMVVHCAGNLASGMLTLVTIIQLR